MWIPYTLGEIKRYRKPPGIIANCVVALMVSVGDSDVIAAVGRMDIETIRRYAKTNEKDTGDDKEWDKAGICFGVITHFTISNFTTFSALNLSRVVCRALPCNRSSFLSLMSQLSQLST